MCKKCLHIIPQELNFEKKMEKKGMDNGASKEYVFQEAKKNLK